MKSGFHAGAEKDSSRKGTQLAKCEILLLLSVTLNECFCVLNFNTNSRMEFVVKLGKDHSDAFYEKLLVRRQERLAMIAPSFVGDLS